MLLSAATCLLSFAAQAPTPRYQTVVSIVVDQLGAEVLKQRLPFISKTGGFQRLLDEGTYVESLEFAHAITETAPGHAALYTGGTPRENGVLFNERPGPDGKLITFMLDTNTHLVSEQGVLPEPGASAKRMHAPTVAQQLQALRPTSRIVSFSMKDRGALLPLGRAKGEAIWLDVARGQLVTSTQVAPLLWVYATPVQGFINQHRTALWQSGPLPDGAQIARDDQPGEGDLGGFGAVFPHSYAKAKSFGAAFRTTPAADEAVLALAKGAMLQDPPPELMMLSLSANDATGHLFGPSSREAYDVFLKLDALLGRFFGLLDQRFGKQGWALLLSADHGVTELPELGNTGPRVNEAALQKTLNSIISIDLGKAEWVNVVEPYVWLMPAAKKLKPAQQQRIFDVVEKSLLGTPGVETVVAVKNMGGACPGDGDSSIPALVCRSVDPGISGEFYVVLKKNAIWAPTDAPGFGTNHGSPWPNERSVPLFVRAPGRAKPGRVGVSGFRSFSRTLSDLLQIPPPKLSKDAPSFAQP